MVLSFSGHPRPWWSERMTAGLLAHGYLPSTFLPAIKVAVA